MAQNWNYERVSAFEGLHLDYRPEDIETSYCKCTGPDCLTLLCPCFSAAFMCSEKCGCEVCGNAPDIKPGIEMTLEEIDFNYPLPDVLKDVVCTCEKDGYTKLCTGCLMSCQYYASLNPFEKKQSCIESQSESANSSLTFDSAINGMNRHLSTLKQQIGYANPLSFDERIERVPELSQLSSQQQQQITTYTSPFTSSQSMMGNPTFPQCSDQHLNPAHPLSINQTVSRMPEFHLTLEQQKINSVFPQSFGRQIEPYDSLAFNQTVPNMPGLHQLACQQSITSSSSTTFNPPMRHECSNLYSDHFDPKSYYEELYPRKKLSYRDFKQNAMMTVSEKTTSEKRISQNTKKPSKVSLNGCFCRMFSCAQRNCKCLKYGISCSKRCKCNNCQNPHGRRMQ